MWNDVWKWKTDRIRKEKDNYVLYETMSTKKEKKDIYPKRQFDSHLNIEPGVRNHKLWQRR